MTTPTAPDAAPDHDADPSGDLAALAEAEAAAEALLARFDPDEYGHVLAGLYVAADGTLSTRYVSMRDHAFHPDLVALVSERMSHPVFTRFRSRRHETCTLLSGFPADQWDDALSALYLDGDDRVRTRHRLLRLV